VFASPSRLFLIGFDGKAFTAFGHAPLQHCPTVLGGHAFAEAMGAVSFYFGRLVCWFALRHGAAPSFSGKARLAQLCLQSNPCF